MFITFKASLEEIEEIVTTPACVRSIVDATYVGRRPIKSVGVQFGELSQSQRLIMNLVYRHLIKEV